MIGTHPTSRGRLIAVVSFVAIASTVMAFLTDDLLLKVVAYGSSAILVLLCTTLLLGFSRVGASSACPSNRVALILLCRFRDQIVVHSDGMMLPQKMVEHDEDAFSAGLAFACVVLRSDEELDGASFRRYREFETQFCWCQCFEVGMQPAQMYRMESELCRPYQLVDDSFVFARQDEFDELSLNVIMGCMQETPREDCAEPAGCELSLTAGKFD